MWACLLSGCTVIFDAFLKSHKRKDGGSTSGELESLAQFLLVQFNHNLREVIICNTLILTNFLGAKMR